MPCLNSSFSSIQVTSNALNISVSYKYQERGESIELNCISKWSTPEEILHLLAKNPEFASQFGSIEKLIVYNISSQSIKEKFNLLEYLESLNFHPSSFILAKLEDYSSAFDAKVSDFFDYFPLSFKFKAYYNQAAVLFIKSFSDQPPQSHNLKIKQTYYIDKSPKTQGPAIEIPSSFLSYKLALKISGLIELTGSITSEKFLTWGEAYCSAFESGFKPLLIFYVNDITKATLPQVTPESIQMIDCLCKSYQQQIPSKKQYINDYEIIREIYGENKEEIYYCEDIERELEEGFCFLQEKVNGKNNSEESRKEQKNECVAEEDMISFIVKEGIDDNFAIKNDKDSLESERDEICGEEIARPDEVLVKEKVVEEMGLRKISDLEDAKVDDVPEHFCDTEGVRISENKEKIVLECKDEINKPSSRSNSPGSSSSSSSSSSSTPSRKKSD